MEHQIITELNIAPSDFTTLDFSKIGLKPIQHMHPMNLDTKPRLTREQHIARAVKTVKRGIRPVSELVAGWAGKTLIIVGGGPSLKDSFHDLSLSISSRRDKVCVMALNQSHDFLIKGERDPNHRKKWLRHPIVPEFALMLDPKPWCANYMTPHPKPLYLFGTGLDDVVWEKFTLHPFARTYWWYPVYDKAGADLDDFIAASKVRDFIFLAGGSTVGLRALNMAMMLGFGAVELWGFDSCYAPGVNSPVPVSLHAYHKPNTQHAFRKFTIVSKNEQRDRFSFVSNDAMAAQVKEFATIVQEIEALVPGTVMPEAELHSIWGWWLDGVRQRNQAYRLNIKVAGDGAIPWMAWKDGALGTLVSHTHPARMAAKYGMSKHWDYDAGAERVA